MYMYLVCVCGHINHHFIWLANEFLYDDDADEDNETTSKVELNWMGCEMMLAAAHIYIYLQQLIVIL